MNKTNRISAAAILLGPVISFLSACTYTAPFRRVETTSPENNTAIVTLTAVECKPGQRAPFFADTKRVLADQPLQAGLLGYSFRFQLFGRKAWTMTVWKNAAARDQFASSPIHRIAIMNSRTTSQNMRFLSIEIPAHELPLKWSEALKMLEKAPVYE